EQEVRTQANARHADGYLVVRRDPRQVARFVRLQAAPLPCAADELALRYRVRNGRPRIVTNAWFFPEGQAERYAPARYGEFRVGQDGEALLVALRDQELRPLGPDRPAISAPLQPCPGHGKEVSGVTLLTGRRRTPRSARPVGIRQIRSGKPAGRGSGTRDPERRAIRPGLGQADPDARS